MDFDKVANSDTVSSMDFQSFSDTYKYGKISLMKFFSNQRKSKLVDFNLLKLISNIISSPEDIYYHMIKEINDVVLLDKKEIMYWYHSWNHRTVKCKKTDYTQKEIFTGYHGIISTIEDWDNYNDDNKCIVEYEEALRIFRNNSDFILTWIPVSFLKRNLEFYLSTNVIQLDGSGNPIQDVGSFIKDSKEFDFDSYWERFMRIQMNIDSSE
jgi:hypothetical protein